MTTHEKPLSENKITLKLKNGTNVDNLPAEEIFQQEARKELFLKIIEQLDSISDDKKDTYALDDIFYDRYHNAITICGSRGSGKSTLIRHILTSLHDASNSRYEKNENEEFEIPKSLSVLPVIDPTLIESKEHVLIILISKIREKVEFLSQNASEKELNHFNKALKKLAGGLCQIDGIGANDNYGDEWEDQSYILETGLKKATEGRRLEQNLNEFINAALKVLNKKAFLVTFDDIDTQFERGWPVLETARKYLTSERLIILISGDIELYQKLVRSAQFSSIGKNILEYDRPSSSFHTEDSFNSFNEDKIIRQISDLEEQYLLKVLKPENRVHMLTLKQRQTKKGTNFGIEILSNSELKISIEKYLSEVAKVGFGISKSQDQAVLISAILNLPARTLMQVMKASTLLIIVTPSGIFPNNSGILTDKSCYQDFTVKILDSFSSSISGLKFNLIDMKSAQFSISKLNNIFWEWGIDENLWNRFNRLLPTSQNEVINNRVLTFLALVNNHAKFSISNSFEWMFLVSLPKCIALDFKEKKSAISIQQLLSHISIGDNYINLNETVSKSIAALLSNDVSSKIKPQDYGFYRVPYKKDLGLKIESMVSKFYQSQVIKDVNKEITGLGQTNNKPIREKKTKLRQRLKDSLYYTLSSQEHVKDSFYDNPLLGEWHKALIPFFSKTARNSSDKVKDNARVTGVFYNRICELTSNSFDLGHLSNLALTKIRGLSTSQETGFISAITLFSNIVTLLHKNINSEDDLKVEIQRLYSQEVTHVPDWNDSNSDEYDGSEYEVLSDEERIDPTKRAYDKGFYKRLFRWIKTVQNRWHSSNISPSSLINMFENYYAFMKSVRHDNALGSLFHAQIVSLFHAAMIEDGISKDILNLSQNAISTAEREFFENYKKFYGLKPEEHFLNLTTLESRVEFGMYTILVSCPLFGVFLRQKPKTATSVPKTWDWLMVHSCNYLLLCESEQDDFKKAISKDKDLLDENVYLKFKEEFNKLKSPAKKEQKLSDFKNSYHKNRVTLINSYLDDLKVEGELEGIKLEFSNLFTLLNTVPIMTGGSHKLEIKIDIHERPVTETQETEVKHEDEEISVLSEEGQLKVDVTNQSDMADSLALDEDTEGLTQTKPSQSENVDANGVSTSE